VLARIFGACVVGVGLGMTAAMAAPATFQAGEDAYIALHFAEAKAAYRAAAASGTAKDRADSLRQLGVIAWRLDGHPAEAERYFRDALAVGADVSATQAEFERFLASEKRFDEAAVAGDAALAMASTSAERRAALHACANSILSKVDGVAIAAQSPADVVRLGHVRDGMRGLSENPPMPLDLSADLLEIAIRLDDGALALTAWMSYAREGAEKGVWSEAARKLQTALPAWRSGANQAVRNDVFDGLRLSQFFALAALIAQDQRVADSEMFLQTPRVRETLAYAAFIKDTQSATESYYRDMASERADVTRWKNALSGMAQTLWGQLDFGAKALAFSETAFGREIRLRLGAVMNVGETGDHIDMHYGHVFVDDQRTVEQYGRKAELRLIALDRVVSNGYESWVWDGRQAHGGWANEEGIFQVRPQYADDALTTWERMSDPLARAEVEEKIARYSAGEDEIARRDAAPFLPGLASRLRWLGQNALVDNLRKQGFTGAEIKRLFMLDLNRIILDSSIFAHEGRHALDDRYEHKMETEELEFRAKLSEVVFSERPRLSFGSIFNPNMGDPTSPHGRANKRIAKGLVAWMDAHRAEIAGLDAARPLLPQFDKLNDDQMRAAMRTMDPWAK
jgi:hypothetical protein